MDNIPYCKCWLNIMQKIPKDVVMEEGLQKKKHVVVKDPTGKGWTVKLCLR